MSATTPFSWDSEHWGEPGWNVHHATTDDLGSTRQPHADRDQSGDDQ